MMEENIEVAVATQRYTDYPGHVVTNYHNSALQQDGITLG